MVTGTPLTYVAGTGHRPIPLATDGVRRTHEPPAPKPTGLDWDAITPTCHGCGTKSGQLNAAGICPTCRGVQPSNAKKTRKQGYAAIQLPEDELLRRFTGPDGTALGRELAELERTDPKVAAAAVALEDAVDRMVRPDDHVVPEHLEANTTELPTEGKQGQPTTRSSAPRANQASSTTGRAPVARPSTHREKNPVATQETRPDVATGPEYTEAANLDAQVQHATRVLRDTVTAQHPATRLLRLNAIAALEALHLFHQLNPETPAPATPSPHPAGAGQASPEPLSASQRLGGGRPAARTEGEAVARPATRRPRPRVDAARIIDLYTSGKYMREIQAETGNAISTIKRVLVDAGVPIRPRGPKTGDKHKTYDPTLIDDVRRLYVDEKLNQTQVAEQLGLGVKVVQNVMRAAGIPARATAVERSQAGIGRVIKIPHDQHPTIVERYQAGEPATVIARDYDVDPASIYPILKRHGIERHGNRVAPGVDTLGRLRAAIAATGATSRQIKDWALKQGLLGSITVGLPHLGLVEAYTAAHPNPTGDPTP